MKIEKAVKMTLLQFREKRGELKTGKRKEWNKKIQYTFQRWN